MPESIELTTVIRATAKQIYQAWLDGDQHGWMTGSEATCDPQIGGTYTAWDGYIVGRTLEMEPYSHILQSWRTSDFAQGDSDSMLEVMLEAVTGGTRITLLHGNLPDGTGVSYHQGWIDNYFEPMKKYFASLGQD